MLQNIGDKFKGTGEGGGGGHRWVWYVIIGALGLVFAASGAFGVVDLSFGRGAYAVKVNGEDVPAERVLDLWQRQLPDLMEAFGGDLTAEQRREFQQQLLDISVRELATTQHARELGYGISNAEAARAFRAEESFQIDGQFSLQEAQVRLFNAGVTEQQYLEDLRRRLLANRLLGVIGVTDFLTPAESRRLLSLLDEERQVRFVMIDPTKYAGNAPVAPEAIQAYYQANLDQFAVPESVKLAYAEMSLSDVAATVTVTEEELRARYELDKDQYIQPETRQARHILITVDDPANDAASASKAQDLYTQIKAGGDFAALARANSDDTASASAGGDLGWATRETYVQAFGDKLFSMQTGEVSEPVKTEFGYHIIKLEGVRPATGRTFDQVRGELSAALRNEKAIARFNSEQDRLQEQLESGTSSLDTLVREFGLRRGEIENFERGAGGLPLGSDAALNREVFSDALLSQRRIGGPAQLSEDRITIFQVLEHRPASSRPLEQVREEIVADLIRERGAAAALEAAQKAQAQLAEGRSFDQVAKDLGLKAEPARYVARNAADLPVELAEALFKAARPTAETPVRETLKLEDGSVVLYEAKDTRVGAQLDIPQLVDLRSQRELERYTRRDIDAYIGSLVKDAKVRENLAVFEQ